MSLTAQRENPEALKRADISPLTQEVLRNGTGHRNGLSSLALDPLAKAAFASDVQEDHDLPREVLYGYSRFDGSLSKKTGKPQRVTVLVRPERIVADKHVAVLRGGRTGLAGHTMYTDLI